MEASRITKSTPLIDPQSLWNEMPVTPQIQSLIRQTREWIANIIHGKDDRLFVVVGPCSIHDPNAALDYAKKLAPLAKKLRTALCIVMRVYFEKPRTTLGWKGLINDPFLDASFQTNHGLHITRQLLLDINQLGLPTGSEFLDTIIPQYISDLTSWTAIGARTTESQTHRELASALPMPVGFKNGTSGDVNMAIDAVYAAHHPHRFLSITPQGTVASIASTGNPDCHIILRGSHQKPNFDSQSIQLSTTTLTTRNLEPRLMVDCSHGNSGKDHHKQLAVLTSLIQQISTGSNSICGVMLESNLIEGKQSLVPGQPLIYGQSVTDPCLGWENTIDALEQLSDAVTSRRKHHHKNSIAELL